jgi:uncharacterized OB-fold protein
MSNAVASSSSRPTVVPDSRSQPFFDGCSRGLLLIRRCIDCESWNAPGDPFCSNCGKQRLEWAPASGGGTVHTFGIVHHISHPGFANEAPYNVAVVELEEGPRLSTHIIGCRNEDIHVGMPVVVEFVVTEADVSVPKFRPRAQA